MRLPILTHIFLIIVTSRILSCIDTTDFYTIVWLRVFYILSVLGSYVIYYIVKRSIINKDDNTKFKYISGKKKGSDIIVETTYKEYDLKEIDNATNSLFRNAMVILMIQMLFQWNSFFFKQITNPFINALLNDTVAVHLFHKDIKRPFTSRSFWQFVTRKHIPKLVEEKTNDEEDKKIK